MQYSWEIFQPGRSGLHVSLNPPWADVEDADSAQEIADRITPQLLPGQRLNIWDTVGVGKPPVLTVDGRRS